MAKALLYTFKFDFLPPSINRTYKVGGGKFYKDDAANDFVLDVLYSLRKRPRKPIDVPAELRVVFTIKNRFGQRDIDNLCKSLADALQKNGVIKNDALFHRIVLEKRPGKVEGTSGLIFEYEDSLAGEVVAG